MLQSVHGRSVHACQGIERVLKPWNAAHTAPAPCPARTLGPAAPAAPAEALAAATVRAAALEAAAKRSDAELATLHTQLAEAQVLLDAVHLHAGCGCCQAHSLQCAAFGAAVGHPGALLERVVRAAGGSARDLAA